MSKMNIEDHLRETVRNSGIEELRVLYKRTAQHLLDHIEEMEAEELRDIYVQSESVWFGVCIGLEMRNDLRSAKAMGIID
jgi:sulfopyruvate decarboxylase TPP-binding subunit